MELAERDDKKMWQAEAYPVEPVHKVEPHSSNHQQAGNHPDQKGGHTTNVEHNMTHMVPLSGEMECHAWEKRKHIKKVCRSSPMAAQTP